MNGDIIKINIDIVLHWCLPMFMPEYNSTKKKGEDKKWTLTCIHVYYHQRQVNHNIHA